MKVLKSLRKKLIAVSIISAFSQVGIADDITALYGDPTFNRVVAIDVIDMVAIADIPTASTPYPVDAAGGLDKAYAITRGANSIDIIDVDTLTNIGSIALVHRPRSGEAHNGKLNVVLIAGADKPMTSIIDPDTDTVLATAGDNTVTTPNGDYGGGLASGHPYWFSKRKFAVIDRANRKVELYKLVGDKNSGFSVQYLDEISTPTTVHHFVKRDRSASHGEDRALYYALAEGSPTNNIPPKLLEVKVKGNQIELKRSVDLSGFNPANMGSHHADLHPNGKHIYMGSTEGHTFVIDREQMQIDSVINTGSGSGHTKFIASRNMAVITNHKDTFLTIVDADTHTKITDVTVSPAQANGQILQSHTSFVDFEGDNFYAFASDSGIFYELNLDSLSITRTVDTGGTPRQGVFMLSDD